MWSLHDFTYNNCVTWRHRQLLANFTNYFIGFAQQRTSKFSTVNLIRFTTNPELLHVVVHYVQLTLTQHVGQKEQFPLPLLWCWTAHRLIATCDIIKKSGEVRSVNDTHLLRHLIVKPLYRALSGAISKHIGEPVTDRSCASWNTSSYEAKNKERTGNRRLFWLNCICQFFNCPSALLSFTVHWDLCNFSYWHELVSFFLFYESCYILWESLSAIRTLRDF